MFSGRWCILIGLDKIAKKINDKNIAEEYFNIISKNCI